MRIILAIIMASILSTSALAQIKKPNLDPLKLFPQEVGGSKVSSDPIQNILGALDDKLLPDLQYALKLATASGSKVTAPCYQTWIEIIQTRQKANTNPDGSAIDLPNPRLITDFEKAVELRNALQPDSAFMLACSPVANMIKQDMIKFIGIILSGGAGLTALGVGL